MRTLFLKDEKVRFFFTKIDSSTLNGRHFVAI